MWVDVRTNLMLKWKIDDKQFCEASDDSMLALRIHSDFFFYGFIFTFKRMHHIIELKASEVLLFAIKERHIQIYNERRFVGFRIFFFLFLFVNTQLPRPPLKTQVVSTKFICCAAYALLLFRFAFHIQPFILFRRCWVEDMAFTYTRTHTHTKHIDLFDLNKNSVYFLIYVC